MWGSVYLSHVLMIRIEDINTFVNVLTYVCQILISVVNYRVNFTRELNNILLKSDDRDAHQKNNST